MVYVSTACLKGKTWFEKDFYKVLETYVKAGIKDIELGSCHGYFSDLKKLFKMQKDNGLNFIVHTFFPPLKDQLWVNIASQNQKVLKASLGVATNAMDLCRKIDAPLYTIHPGYTVEFKGEDDLVKNSDEVPYSKAFSTFLESIQKLADKASTQGLKLGVETQYNKMGYMLLSRAEEFEELFSKVTNKNLGILFDTGHVYSNGANIGVDVPDFINRVKEKVIAFHLHDPNKSGNFEDNHQKIKSLDFFKDFDKGFFKDKFLTLEVTKLNINEILQQKKFLDQLE